MFVDKNFRKQQYGESYLRNTERLSPNNILFIVLGLLLSFAFIGSVFVLVLERPISKSTVSSTGNSDEKSQKNKEILATSSLPSDINNNNNQDGGNSGDNIGLRAEDLNFGYFYKKFDDDFESSFETYNLPINIKTDVLNYYDVSRKINLDSNVSDLNDKGFSFLEKKYLPKSGNFFEAYRYLSENEIPLVVTNDFIFYYYQNTLKNVFKEIEKNAFYENIWNINKALLDKSVIRYRQHLDLVGNINDPVLEAERLEVAYFSVALKLLMPENSQINRKTDFIDLNKFNEQEADLFGFTIPSFLEAEVLKEVSLIRGASGTKKSPVFLYPISYSDFSVPDSYKGNAKLNNFYLATKWFNSVFPLYYKTSDCPDCLLDHDDWVINMGAASLIAKDLYEDQDLKNQWAVVYKIISFFNGLRSDLTYLHYNDALTDLFGGGYNVETIFEESNNQREFDFLKIQNKISEYNFLDIEGAIDRNDAELKPSIGMRMLQNEFWPNDYLLEYLTGKELLTRDTKARSDNITICTSRDFSSSYRCRGLGLDILNLFYPIPANNEYFKINTDYYNYSQRFNDLEEQINYFDVNTWNSNVYWMTLDISKRLVGYSRDNMPVFMSNPEWEDENDFNASLGAWVNLHLSADTLGIYEPDYSSGGLDTGHRCNFYNYIEPNISFVEELIAKNEMLIDMFSALGITKKTNTASIELSEVNGKFEQLISIMKKELSDESIDDDDCSFIEDFAQHYVVTDSGSKSFSIKFSGKTINESIREVKPVVIVYRKGDKKIMAVGPKFNYQEN